ncbi:hypothetical protein [Pseudogemmobacter humi]|uniref:Uncharacterized protein n=1 Tax=Pseudogemmobacter humi TaxID=2483812 RepID=A0A3P5XV50_9RHOB|nr:hypothetical protein [Pseudogemmobacter humi]VDC33057.1 hypothetical protein XINFAN_03603 [Pseudogemmobacter humi]
MRVAVFAGMAALAAAVPALADIAVETKLNGKSEVTLHLHPFLSEEELTLLRMVQTNDQALAIFVPGKAGFAALAVSPDDGFLRNGQPVPSAIALADLPDAATAEKEALAACDATRKGKNSCVLVLTVAPGG